MNITIINDCCDANAAGRQITRAVSLIGGVVSFIGVASDLEASGNLVDALDACGENSGIILVNVAPRNGKAKRWNNGTPFGYFWYKKILVVATIDGLTLSFVKKLGLVQSINVLDIPTVLDVLVEDNKNEFKKHIANSQFRSYDFLPRIARFLLKHKGVRSTPLNTDEIPNPPSAIWWIDNFGNCKTSILPEEVIHKGNNRVATKLGNLFYCPRLKDVPEKSAALVIGSSGIENKRFLEIVVQGKNAAKHFSLSSGDLIL